ncbi:hypothetical protein K435DRAFT_460927 [Dendrothele bispora CBS 962.96]|uniref:Uncharacterized protein n=1 Tax=Dendrothele bispora (strain CBS 962.96) TaxID=1314807 RepID=A0A4V4HC71_DENBC|nr:hypothetical protein K435DRAFT_460927 [Dendrothele bispora CBS 962.96]
MEERELSLIGEVPWKALGGYWVGESRSRGRQRRIRRNLEEVELLSEHGIMARVKGMVKTLGLHILGFFNFKGLEVKVGVEVRRKTRKMGICRGRGSGDEWMG